MKILGIETSCDETAVAILQDTSIPSQRIISNLVYSQIAEHNPYGGVVPELAARAHLKHLPYLLDKAFKTSGLSLQKDIDLIAATCGPGLMGGLLVGVMTAKAIAIAANKPFIAVNHLEGHALTARLTDNVTFPYLLLLASGGHCQFLLAKNVGDYILIGETLDDAAGEAFDKVGKLLGLTHPGGPAIEKIAINGDATRYPLPVPLKHRKDCALSFSGLKTAVRDLVKSFPTLDEQTRCDIAASFQNTVAQLLIEKTYFALKESSCKTLVFAGGVAANQVIRNALKNLCDNHQINFVVPPSNLCVDNAAMVAWAGLERYKNFPSDISNDWQFSPTPRWSLQNYNLYKYQENFNCS